MNRKQLARAKKLLGNEDGPILVGTLCAHDERLANPEHHDRLVTLATYLRPHWSAADVLGTLADLQASPTRAEFQALMGRFLDNLFERAVEAGLIRQDDPAEEQMLGLSGLVLTTMASKAETPLGDQDLRHAEMIALLSGMELEDDEHGEVGQTLH